MAGTATKLFETRIPVTCGGVRVEPGDILFGDDDGIIVAGPNEWKTMINAAEEIQRKEAELRKSEEKYRRIVTTAAEGFILMDEQMLITDANEAYCRMTGYQLHELLGQNPFFLMAEESGQSLTFHILANSNPALFSTLPTLDEYGTLRFEAAWAV